MTVLWYDRVRITLRDATGEWTYEQGPWRQHMTITKEKLLREIADWVKRSQHEAKLAFAEGDLWSALAWGSKVPSLLTVEKCLLKEPYETGKDVDGWHGHVTRIVSELDAHGSELDAHGSIKAMDQCPHDLIIGVDMGMNAPLESEIEELGSGPGALNRGASSDEELRKRCRDRIRDIGIGSVLFYEF